MNTLRNEDQHASKSCPLWISDIESKDYLRTRKLAGDWTLTIDACMWTSEVFKKNYPVYDDGSCYPQLSFFRMNVDCAALEWDVRTLECRIWILVPEVREADIEARMRLLCDTFSSYIDFRKARLTLEEEPNELTLVGANDNRLPALREVVANVERKMNSPPRGVDSVSP